MSHERYREDARAMIRAPLVHAALWYRAMYGPLQKAARSHTAQPVQLAGSTCVNILVGRAPASGATFPAKPSTPRVELLVEISAAAPM